MFMLKSQSDNYLRIGGSNWQGQGIFFEIKLLQIQDIHPEHLWQTDPIGFEVSGCSKDWTHYTPSILVLLFQTEKV
jgi:hypothetical protein